MTSARTERRLGVLDVLRLFAAVAVVAFHYTARHSPAWDGPAPDALAGVGQWAAYGRMGVPLFFVISGFVLLMSAWGRDVRGFVASRVGRLFPAYWVAVAFSLVLVLFVWPENPAFLGHEISKAGAALNLTMVQGAFGVPDIDGPYWTLWYEARFYLLIALFMLVGITRNRVLAVCALWPVVGALASANDAGLVSTLLMPDYAPFFAGGMLLYLVYRDGHDLGTWLLVGLQVSIALNFTTGVYPGILGAETPWVPSTTVIAVLCVACFGLVALVTLTRVAHRSAHWMTLAGALTYPLYLVHENLGWWVIHLVRDRVGPWGAVGLATVVALIAATLLHHLVEKPFGPRLRTATLRMLSQPEGGRATGDGRDGAHPVGRGRAAEHRTAGIPVPVPAHGRSAADDRSSAGRHPLDAARPSGARHADRRPSPRTDPDLAGPLGPSTVALPHERPAPGGVLLTGPPHQG